MYVPDAVLKFSRQLVTELRHKNWISINVNIAFYFAKLMYTSGTLSPERKRTGMNSNGDVTKLQIL